MDKVARFVTLLTLIAFSGGNTEAGWQVKEKKPSNGVPWVLSHEGSITRGDPKTTYDQSENQQHSQNHQPKPPVLDISGWTLNGQGGCNAPGTTGYCMEYLSPATLGSGIIDRVVIEYNRTEGKAVSAYRETMTATGADYTRTALDPNLVTRQPYCTNYGCIQ